MAGSTEKNNFDLQEADDYTARVEELEREKIKQEALLAKHTAEVEALQAHKELLEALLAATIKQNSAPAA